MKISLFNQFGAKNSVPVFESMAQGIRSLGHQVAYHDTSADVAVIWSMVWAGRMKPNFAVWQEFRKTQRPVIVLEVGALQRGTTWKLGFNGLGAGCYSTAELDPGRVEKLKISLCPWQQSGQNILIVCQRTDSEQWQGQPSIHQWISDTVCKLRRYTDRPIVVRPHPRERINPMPGIEIQKPRAIVGTYDDFDFAHALKQAWAVVNWNSGTGSQAVIQGVPAFVSASSLAAPVANTAWDQIESPARPDRTKWVLELAHTEWTTKEIATGEPAKRVLSLV